MMMMMMVCVCVCVCVTVYKCVVVISSDPLVSVIRVHI